MEKECDANSAFLVLKEETRNAYENEVLPQYKGQYRAAWLEFKRKIEEAKK